jgi:hypothetical protein
MILICPPEEGVTIPADMHLAIWEARPCSIQRYKGRIEEALKSLAYGLNTMENVVPLNWILVWQCTVKLIDHISDDRLKLDVSLNLDPWRRLHDSYEDIQDNAVDDILPPYSDTSTSCLW